jgi:hypothetical protein
MEIIQLAEARQKTTFCRQTIGPGLYVLRAKRQSFGSKAIGKCLFFLPVKVLVILRREMVGAVRFELTTF